MRLKKRRYWKYEIGWRSKAIGGKWQNVCLDCLLVKAADKGRGNEELTKKSVVCCRLRRNQVKEGFSGG